MLKDFFPKQPTQKAVNGVPKHIYIITIEKKKKSAKLKNMSCTNPLYALKLPAINPKTGKQRQKVLPRRPGEDYFTLCERHGKENIIPLPCGKCSSCVEARSKSWAIRCLCEAVYYEQSCFLTLTYNNAYLPEFGLCKHDLQKFFKRLRFHLFGNNKGDLRYFACGEYGEHTKRPHYHVIIFGYWPEDAKFQLSTKDGNYFYSKLLNKIWKYGFVQVGEVSYKSCCYVARYIQKKLKNRDSKYKEFLTMSLKPGIGTRFFEENYEKIYKYDAIFGNFGRSLRHRPSRYFDKLFEKFDASSFQHLKEVRISKAWSQVVSDMLDHGFVYYEDLLRHSASIKDDKMSKLRRRDL